MTTSLALKIYLALSTVAQPVYRAILKRRVAAGKEDPNRLTERFGKTTTPRPDGKVVWFHAASVGESQALRGAIAQLLKTHGDLFVVITTTTRTSAALLDQQLPNRAVHQFSPIDTPQATKAFLDHWQPDVAVWTESEIWPRLIIETAERHIPMHLINARVSPRTARSWRKWAGTIGALLGRFNSIATQDTATAELILSLGVSPQLVEVTGSTKARAPALSCDRAELKKLSAQIDTRKCWLAASTHRGEEGAVLKAHAEALRQDPDTLLIIAPRHPERGDEIAELISQAGYNSARRTQQEDIETRTQVYLADTMGEMGLWYRLAPVAFIGGSLEPVGGHNPFEPVGLGAFAISGPHVFNFVEAYKDLEAGGKIALIEHADDLAPAVLMRLSAAPDNLQQTHVDPSGVEDDAEAKIIKRIEQDLT